MACLVAGKPLASEIAPSVKTDEVEALQPEAREEPSSIPVSLNFFESLISIECYLSNFLSILK